MHAPCAYRPYGPVDVVSGHGAMRLPTSSPSNARSGVDPVRPNGDPLGARNRPVVRNSKCCWSRRATRCIVRLPSVGEPTSSARWCYCRMPANNSALLAVWPLITSVRRSWRGSAVPVAYSLARPSRPSYTASGTPEGRNLSARSMACSKLPPALFLRSMRSRRINTRQCGNSSMAAPPTSLPNRRTCAADTPALPISRAGNRSRGCATLNLGCVQ